MEICEKIINYAKNNDKIIGVVLNGSRANPNAKCDAFSDYDIVFVTDDIAESVQQYDGFCKLFGEIMISQQPDGALVRSDSDYDKLNKYTFLTVFEGGLRIDLSYVRADKACEYMNSERFSKVLLDKRQYLSGVTNKASLNELNCDSDKFLLCCNEFWWVLPYVYKGILREKPIYAASHIERCLREEMHKMLCWYFASEKNCVCDKNGDWVKEVLNDDYASYLTSLNLSSLTAIRKSAQITTSLFSKFAKLVANKFDFEYNFTEEQNCYRYLSIFENKQVVLETERLILRKFCDSDIDNLSTILCDKDVMYAYEHAFSSSEVMAWLDKMLFRYYTEGVALWSVELKNSGEFIGQAGLTYQDIPKGRVLEIGYLFAKKYWKNGYAIESAKAIKDYAFNELCASEVYSIIRENNDSSIAVAVRNGMVEESTFTKHYMNMDMPHKVFVAKREQA